MATARSPAKAVGEYTVAMIFAMGFEMSAFRYMLDEEHEMAFENRPNDQNYYILGRISKHNVVLAWLPGEQGKGAAAMVAKDLERTFESIQWRFLVGIGGAVPSSRHDIRLGDVVVSMPYMEHGGVVQYDLGRETDEEYQLKGFLRPPPAYLRGVVGKMESDHMGCGNKIETFVAELLAKGSKLKTQYQRPPLDSDVLFPDDIPHNPGSASCENCDKSTVVSREERAPGEMTQIHYGLIASGDSVVASTTARKKIVDRLGADVLCFEMEAAGIMSGYECLVIRGISDYADSHKCRHWRYYAAAAAAACAKELLLLARPTATSLEKGPGGDLDASDDASGGKGRGRGNHYRVYQGALAADNSTIKTGDWTFTR